MISSKVYSEVYEILSYMDKITVMKIPIDILEEIKNNRDVNYSSRINPTDPFNKKNVDRQTRVFIAWLDYNYWANSDEKTKLKKRYRENQFKHEEELRRNYYLNNKPMFFTNENTNSEVNAIEENRLVAANNNFLLNLKNLVKKILSIFKK